MPWKFGGSKNLLLRFRDDAADDAGTKLFAQCDGNIAEERISISRSDRHRGIHHDAKFGITKRDRHGAQSRCRATHGTVSALPRAYNHGSESGKTSAVVYAPDFLNSTSSSRD